MKSRLLHPIYFLTLILIPLSFGAVSSVSASPEMNRDGIKDGRPLVQIALLLDTSGSMDGLLEQAKVQLWDIVNELAAYRRGGKHPRLEVALYEYGNDGISKWSGHIRQVTPLTDDLDRVSSELFKLRTNGGSEYCGMAIGTAIEGLNWSTREETLRLLYIAGNEPFTQGPIPFRTAIKAAKAKDVVVNTIYCGGAGHPEATSWIRGAELADGSFMSIDHNRRVVDIRTPYDEKIQSLGVALNSTYVSFSKGGEKRKERQMKADQQAAGFRSGGVARAQAKAGKMYTNATWDLVDAAAESSAALGSVAASADSSKPNELQGLDEKELRELVAKKRTSRKRIQQQIQALSKQREAYLQKHGAVTSKSPGNLNTAFRKSLQKAASGKGLHKTD